MAITQVRWTRLGARDIHLTPGLVSPRLRQLLRIYDEDLDVWFDADDPPQGVSFGVTFRAAFRSAPSAHGVQVHAQTGDVTMLSNQPVAGPRLRSFIVTATVNQGSDEVHTRIRIHLHDQVKTRWLTPSQLTVREGAKNMRFSVLARFEDGVIGDITNWSPRRQVDTDDLRFVHPVGSTDPVHRWGPQRGDPSTDIYVDQVTGEITCEDPTASTIVSVFIDMGNPLAKAKAIGAPKWSTPVKVSRVAGPGFAAMEREDVRNVLFLPDGFADTPAEKSAFTAYVRKLVNTLSTNPHSRPFDLLASKFNYFSAWVPSPQAGVSTLSEQYTVKKIGAELRGKDLALPEAPDDPPPASLRLVELIDVVGPPTPVFDPPGSPPGDDSSGRVRDWQMLYGPVPTAARTAKRYEAWLKRSDRLLVNERDTAFHVGDGYRPRIDKALDTGTHIAFHPLRLSTDDFDKFLGGLQDEKGNQLPIIWQDGGKDDALIVILCRSNRSAGTNVARDVGRYLCVTLGDGDTLDYVANVDGDGFDLVPDPVPDDVSLTAWATVAHELAHSFRISDEYGGLGDLPESLIEDVEENLNIQSRAAVVDGDDHLSADDIKWRWPRLAKAGVLADPADGVDAVRAVPGGGFLLDLVRGHGAPFRKGDIVRLRKPDLRKELEFSDQLRVTKVEKDRLTAKPITGVSLDPDDFGDGDLVVVPVRAKDPDPTNDKFGADLQLVSALVVDRINMTRSPLNADVADTPDWECTGTADVPTPASNFAPDTAPKRPRLSHRLVGLYDNGHGYDCGVYRPTGNCLMGPSAKPDTPGGRRRINTFCPVCRYAMVDLIDPSKHGTIDADFEGDYPI